MLTFPIPRLQWGRPFSSAMNHGLRGEDSVFLCLCRIISATLSPKLTWCNENSLFRLERQVAFKGFLFVLCCFERHSESGTMTKCCYSVMDGILLKTGNGTWLLYWFGKARAREKQGTSIQFWARIKITPHAKDRSLDHQHPLLLPPTARSSV